MNIAENRKRIKALRQYAQAIADQLPPGYARGVHVRNGVVTLKACRVYGDGLWLRWDKNNVMTGTFSHPDLYGQPGDGWSILDANDLAWALKVLTGKPYFMIHTPHVSAYDAPAYRAQRLPIVIVTATTDELRELLRQYGVTRDAETVGYFRFGGDEYRFTSMKGN